MSTSRRGKTRTRKAATPREATPGNAAAGAVRGDVAGAILASIEDHIYLFDREMRYLYAGRAGARALGREPSEFTGRTWRDLGLPALLMEPFEHQVLRVFETGERLASSMTFPVSAGTGHYRYTLAPVAGDGGATVAVLCTVRDVTASDRLRRVIDAVALPVRSATGDGYLRELVVHLSRALGVRQALIGELVGDSEEAIRTVAAVDQGALVPSMEYVLAGTPCENVLARSTCVYKSGVQQLFPRDELLTQMGAESYVGTPLRGSGGAALGLLAVLDDKPVTDPDLATAVLELFSVRAGAELERLRQESALARNRELLLAAERVGRIGSYEWDLATNAVRWSPGMYEVYGVDPAHAEPITFEFAMSFVNRDDIALIETATRAVMNGKGPGDVRYRILRPDGSERMLWGHGVVLRGATDQATRLIGIVQDQTERHQAEAALRESERRYRSLVEHATVGIYRSTLDGRFTFVNRALVDMLGYESEAELLQADMVRDVYQNPDDRARLLREYGDTRVLEGIEVPWRRKDGTPLTVRLSGGPRRGPQGLEGFDMIAEDVTQHRAIERRLQQSQRLESVGRLAGGIAHDLNNVMTAVRAYADVLLADMTAADQAAEVVMEIRLATERAAALTHQLLAFSRQQVLTPMVLDVNTVVARMDQMLRRIIGEDITLVATPGALGRVRADPGQLEQVIMNLVVNARDAMPSGGRLEIRTRDVAELRNDEAGLPAVDAPLVVIEVADSGVGMDAATLSRVFEPFFTTKPVGHGSGLGLATAYGIVKQSGGYIFADSRPGEGATFTVYLPRVDATIEWPVPPPARAGRPTGDETILVVEDDSQVRRLVVQSLRRLGYRILEAQDGAEALALAQVEPGVIHAILTDVIMPGMTGPQVADALKLTRPKARVLFMSGYAGTATQGGELRPGAQFIAKPFSTDELALTIRQLLDQPETVAR